MIASWRTTALGILAGLAIIIGQLTNALDSDPATGFDMDQILMALAMMGFGIAARDNKVSSEKAGVK